MLPMCFNVGIIIGPILGGLLADPVGSYPRLFGQDSTFGGKDGVRWMKRWPYALPNLLNAFFLSVSVIGVILGLQEVSQTADGAVETVAKQSTDVGHNPRQAGLWYTPRTLYSYFV